jgi:thioredoxin-like negative regulator of GroEL
MMAASRHTPSSTDQHDRRQRDRRGLPLTTASPEAAARYRDAIDCVHGSEAGAAELLDQAVAHDPGFALAHLARWMLSHAGSDRAASLAARAAALAERSALSDWERGHIDCLAAIIERQPGAWAQAREHLSVHPKDLLVVTQLLGDMFFHAGPGKREAVMDVLRPLTPHYGADWAFAARLGFHMSELGDPRGALEVLEGALHARPQAPFIAHAMAHALLESGERMESYRFLVEWVARHDPSGPMDGHIHWHLSLGELEKGESSAAVERYLTASAPGVSHCAVGLLLADAAGLFGRMLLDGVSLEGMPRELLREPLAKLNRVRMPFVAVHIAALSAALGDRDALERCVEATTGNPDGSNVAAGHRVVTAFRAYVAGDMRGCIGALERDRPSAWEAIGGSNEERALIQTLHSRAAARLETP